jgi:hypothetical protein
MSNHSSSLGWLIDARSALDLDAALRLRQASYAEAMKRALFTAAPVSPPTQRPSVSDDACTCCGGVVIHRCCCERLAVEVGQAREALLLVTVRHDEVMRSRLVADEVVVREERSSEDRSSTDFNLHREPLLREAEALTEYALVTQTETGQLRQVSAARHARHAERCATLRKTIALLNWKNSAVSRDVSSPALQPSFNREPPKESAHINETLHSPTHGEVVNHDADARVDVRAMRREEEHQQAVAELELRIAAVEAKNASLLAELENLHRDAQTSSASLARRNRDGE